QLPPRPAGVSWSSAGSGGAARGHGHHHCHIPNCPAGRRSGIHPPGKAAATTRVWTMNLRWTWEHQPTMRILL
ncbi:hypothetical protein GOODEAATRI_027694, partial [Goodea atripinnis]